MPANEYKCLDYHKKFSMILTVSDHDKIKVKCPKCGSRKAEQQYATFFFGDFQEKLRPEAR